MDLKYFIDSSNFKELKNFILISNKEIEKNVYKKPNKIEEIKFSMLITLLLTIPFFILGLNMFIVPENDGSYFSWFSLDGSKIFSNMLSITLSSGIILFLLVYFIFKYLYSNKKNKMLLEYIQKKYCSFKGNNILVIKKDLISVKRENSNLTIESKILKKIIKYNNIIFFIDKKEIPLLFVPINQINIDYSKLTYLIEENLNMKISEV